MIVRYGTFYLRWVCLFLVSCWLTLIVMTQLPTPLLLTVPVLFALVTWHFRGKDAYHQMSYNAHWATPKELAPMRVDSEKQKSSVLVGFAYGKALAVTAGLAQKKELGNFLYVGPSRSGKGLAIYSNAFNWKHSLLVTDLKGEIFNETAGYREQVLGSRVVVLNPSSGEWTHKYDPFLELETDEQIYSAASSMMDAEADGDNAVFGLRAGAFLAAMIRSAKVRKVPVIPEIERLTNHDEGIKGAALTLEALGDLTVRRWVKRFLGKSASKMDWEKADADRFLQNSWQRLLIATQFLGTPGIIRMTSGSDFRARDLVEGSVSVYLVFRESELAATLPVFNLIVDSIFRALMRHFDLGEVARPAPLLAMFDEAGQVRVNSLPNYSSTVAGRGIYMMTFVQSLGQIEETWGRSGKQTLMDNTHTKVFLPPVDRNADDYASSAAYVASSCGEYLVEERSISKDEHADGIHSNVRVQRRSLITAADFGMLPTGQSVAFTNNLPPILAHRLEHWRFAAMEEARQYPAPYPLKITADGQDAEDELDDQDEPQVEEGPRQEGQSPDVSAPPVEVEEQPEPGQDEAQAADQELKDENPEEEQHGEDQKNDDDDGKNLDLSF